MVGRTGQSSTAAIPAANQQRSSEPIAPRSTRDGADLRTKSTAS